MGYGNCDIPSNSFEFSPGNCTQLLNETSLDSTIYTAHTYALLIQGVTSF